MKTVFFLIKRKVLDTYVHLGSTKDYVRSIKTLSTQDSGSSVLFANACLVELAAHNLDLKKSLEEADVVIPVGASMLKGLKKLYGQSTDETSFSKVLETLTQTQNLKSYRFYGEKSMKEKILKQCPHLELLDFSEMEKDVKNEVLLVFLPAGEQEVWINRMKPQISGCIIGMGGMVYPLSAWKRYRANLSFKRKVWVQKWL
jgi:UDP-N-acetyl-D-mannosaminuronic acid transferase (WecB/TagA/CpsF family)